MKPSELLISDISRCFDRKPCDALLLEAQSETWFSNQLAWLLDPKGSHGLGVKFLNSFVQKVAQHRSSYDKKTAKPQT